MRLVRSSGIIAVLCDGKGGVEPRDRTELVRRYFPIFFKRHCRWSPEVGVFQHLLAFQPTRLRMRARRSIPDALLPSILDRWLRAGCRRKLLCPDTVSWPTSPLTSLFLSQKCSPKPIVIITVTV